MLLQRSANDKTIGGGLGGAAPDGLVEDASSRAFFLSAVIDRGA